VEEPEMEQAALEMPAAIPWRMVGELYNSYIIVEQGEEAFLIDKHAAHERILFEKLKANQEAISSQALLQPLPVRLTPAAAGELLSNRELMEELGLEALSVSFNHSRYYPPSNTLMLNFTVTVKKEDAHPNREVDAWQWFSLSVAREAIKPGSLARAFLLGWMDGVYDFPVYQPAK
jgi:DNA mismatch repair ATPase MutL